MEPHSVARATLLALLVLVAGCAGSTSLTDTGATPTATESAASPLTDVSAPSNGTLAVHFINVGQSVSTLVVGPTGETMLIDTGHFSDDGEHVLQYLQAHDVERIDYLIVSHNDADHIGGNADIIEYYETQADGIGAVYDPGIAASTQTYGEYLDAVEAHGVTLYRTQAGDTIPFEGATVQVLGPPDPFLESGARNENSVVLKITHGESSFLLTGDAEDDQEAQLVDRYGDHLRATVLKAGHHGSASSTGGPLLDAVDPATVVVSSAFDSQYGHPAQATLERLADRSIPTYWTATHGDVVLVSDGQSVSVWTQQPAPTAPLSLRDGDPIAPGTSGAVIERERFATAPGSTPGTAVAADGGTTADSSLVIEQVHADAAGDDRENLDDEYVVFRNGGDGPLDLSGWTVSDEVGKTYTVPDGYVLEAGTTVTLRTGPGADSDTDLYWGADGPVWNNDGDTVTVQNSNGTVVRTVQYE